ncbi:NAD(P)-binding protein, partial [Mycobacteroides abscessus subsp. massiliense]
MTTSIPDHHVAVIGAGIGGLCAGVRLQQAGIQDFVIIDRADDLGGTWRDNVYPGAEYRNELLETVAESD